MKNRGDGASRRNFLKVFMTGVAGFSLATLMPREAHSLTISSDEAVEYFYRSSSEPSFEVGGSGTSNYVIMESGPVEL